MPRPHHRISNHLTRRPRRHISRCLTHLRRADRATRRQARGFRRRRHRPSRFRRRVIRRGTGRCHPRSPTHTEDCRRPNRLLARDCLGLSSLHQRGSRAPRHRGLLRNSSRLGRIRNNPRHRTSSTGLATGSTLGPLRNRSTRSTARCCRRSRRPTPSRRMPHRNTLTRRMPRLNTRTQPDRRRSFRQQAGLSSRTWRRLHLNPVP